VEVDGKRILRIGLREPAGRFKLRPTLGGREDWFTSVDGFVPSLDFGAAVFEHQRFNHAFIAGHLSVKGASREVGYALGVERPFFVRPQLYLGAEVFDLTASDDQWQISSSEAGLAAVGPRRSYRDYYRRRGGQFSARCACTRRSKRCSRCARSATNRCRRKATSACGTTTSRSGRTLMPPRAG
jgi:hypothetical protein